MNTPLWGKAWILGTHLKVPPLKFLFPGSRLCCHQRWRDQRRTPQSQTSRSPTGETGLTGRGYTGHCKAKHAKRSGSAARSSCCREPDSHVIPMLRVLLWASSSVVLRAGARAQLRTGRALLERVFQLSTTQQAVAPGLRYPSRRQIQVQEARRFAGRPHSQPTLKHK